MIIMMLMLMILITIMIMMMTMIMIMILMKILIITIMMMMIMIMIKMTIMMMIPFSFCIGTSWHFYDAIIILILTPIQTDSTYNKLQIRVVTMIQINEHKSISNTTLNRLTVVPFFHQNQRRGGYHHSHRSREATTIERSNP